MNKRNALSFLPVLLTSVVACLFLSSCNHATAHHSNKGSMSNITSQQDTSTAVVSPEGVYQDYLDFFEQVYQKMDENYYRPVTREAYNRFLEQFDSKIYGQLQEKGKSINYVRWRSASLLVEALKSKEDIFSQFYPPKPAKEYEQTALGKRVDLGIKGKLINKGYVVSHVEPRSDAYAGGLRKNDLIIKVDQNRITDYPKDEMGELFNPLEGTETEITFLSGVDKSESTIQVTSKEYFKQTVFMVPFNVEGMFGIEIQRFNRKTFEDMFRFIKHFKDQGEIKGLVLDLRGNPGGPPLAAREISSFFLPAGEDFAYFQKKGHPKAMLDIPTIPEEFHYDGPMVILVNEDSGSASELFSGVLQHRKRAVLMGQNSAGQVMLKSMFHFDNDDSMLLLITARGHHPDGQVFSFDGLIPDRVIKKDEESDIYKYAISYLVYMNQKNESEKDL